MVVRLRAVATNSGSAVRLRLQNRAWLPFCQRNMARTPFRFKICLDSDGCATLCESADCLLRVLLESWRQSWPTVIFGCGAYASPFVASGDGSTRAARDSWGCLFHLPLPAILPVPRAGLTREHELHVVK